MTVRFGLLISAILLVRCSSDPAPTLTVATSLSSTTSIIRDAASRDCGSGGTVCTGSPSTMTMKIYEAYVSLNTDCSSPILVSNFGASGADISVGVQNLISANPAAGTYRCLILKMSDNLRFTPNAAAIAAFPGVCTAAVAGSTFDIYRTDSGDNGLWKNLDGTAITATGSGATAGDNTVYIFATTTPSAVTGGSLHVHTNQTVTLTAPLVVPGQTTFYVDFANGVTGSGGICKIEGGTGMGFR